MSSISAAFFSWVQAASFYVDVHSQAVDLLPYGNGKMWLDVGSGPGLVARLACDRGYDVLGIDRDSAMIEAAKRNTLRHLRCRFEVGDLSRLSELSSADVVSAASLLFVVPDPDNAIRQLWDRVRPGGKLLVIETTELMTPEGARKVRSKVRRGRRLALTLWARARNGRAVSPGIFSSISAQSSECAALLGGLVQAWVFTKAEQ